MSSGRGCDAGRNPGLVTLRTLGKGRQIVVPLAVCVRSQIFPIGGIDYADVAPVAVYQRVKGVGFRLDGLDYLFSRPFPACTAKVRDALMGAVAIALVYAGDTNIGYVRLLSLAVGGAMDRFPSRPRRRGRWQPMVVRYSGIVWARAAARAHFLKDATGIAGI